MDFLESLKGKVLQMDLICFSNVKCESLFSFGQRKVTSEKVK